MDECCNQTESALQKIARRQTSTLKIDLGINVLM